MIGRSGDRVISLGRPQGRHKLLTGNHRVTADRRCPMIPSSSYCRSTDWPWRSRTAIPMTGGGGIRAAGVCQHVPSGISRSAGHLSPARERHAQGGHCAGDDRAGAGTRSRRRLSADRGGRFQPVRADVADPALTCRAMNFSLGLFGNGVGNPSRHVWEACR